MGADAVSEQVAAADLNSSPAPAQALAIVATDWEQDGVVGPNVQAHLIRCLTDLDNNHQSKQAQVKRLAGRLQRAAAQGQKLDAERQRLKEEINAVIGAIDRTLNMLQPSGVDAARLAGSSDEFDLTTALRQVIERAGRRIGSLCNELRGLELSQSIASAQVSHLQTEVAALSDDKRQLEEQRKNLTREISGSRAQDQLHMRQTATAVVQAGRLRHDQQRMLRLLIARVPGYAAYAESVADDPRRLFAFLLLSEIRDRDDISSEIKRHAEQIAEIFDPIFYLEKYSDVGDDGRNPLLHYIEAGWREGRQPHLFFDVGYYRHQVGDISGDPLHHYATIGVFEGKKPHPLLDGAYYWENNPDVATARCNPILHYDLWGCRERRSPSPMFDTEYFLAKYDSPLPCDNPLREYLQQESDWAIDPHPLFSHSYFAQHANVTRFSEAPLVMYLKFPALWEMAKVHPLFDPVYFRSEANKAGFPIPSDISPFEHFCRLDKNSDISPHRLFDSRVYRYQVEAELDRQLSEPPIIDYLKHGFREKSLLPTPLFDPSTYIERNQVESDLPELVHYCLEGDRAGFWCHPMFSAEFYNAGRKDDEKITALEHYLDLPAETGGRTHPHLQRPLLAAPQAFIEQIVAPAEDIDPTFYRAANPDLAELSDADLIAHFNAHGRQEGRFGSPRQLVQQLRLRIRDIPLGFFPEDYVRFNPDLAVLGEDFNALLRHYLEIGRTENRSIGHWQFHLSAAQRSEWRGPTAPVVTNHDLPVVDVCVLIHLGYGDLWPELAGFVQNFDVVTKDVFINVVDEAWSPGLHREIRELCPGAFVQLSNNTGRDIGGFIRLLDNVDFNKYELIALMHSKKSPHIAPEKGAHWRRELLDAFAGSREIVRECVAAFREDPTIGMIGCANYRDTALGDNEEQWRALLDQFEIEEEHRILEYLSGTMFIGRPVILKRIYDKLKEIQFEYGSNMGLEFHRDGQIAHGVERVIGPLVRQLGYRIAWR